ncbi:DUF6125 family protein [Chloroflexota bacterium]
MVELADYSGECIPDIRYDDFSKDMLLRLLKGYAGYVLRVDGLWYLTVKNRNSDGEALACDMDVWEKALKYELHISRDLFNITGCDVAALMKYFQMSPWQWTRDFKYKVELQDSNYDIYTVLHCHTLIALEREDEGRERSICHIQDAQIIKRIAHYVNPSINVRPLKLPPRENRNGFACQWEFSLRE